jgi:ABC-2 type transport system ATP-binding protein
MIAARGLTKHFGRFVAVDAIDFMVPRGRVVGFLGPNGAGKTTTIRMLTGFLMPSAGTVEVDNIALDRDSRSQRRRLGYLPESAPLYGEMRVEEFLHYRARLFALRRHERRGRINLALERCRLNEVRRRPIHHLSKGFRQRVGLAAAILHDPPVLILDEPTAGLDPAQIIEVRRLIRNLAAERTILLSTHILPEVEATCDQVLLMARGRIRAQGTLDEIRRAASDGEGYVLETDVKSADDLRRDLSCLPGVLHIGEQPIEAPWRRFTLRTTTSSTDLRELMFTAATHLGGRVRELRRIAPTLEEVFVREVARAEQEFAARLNERGARTP